jgi:hypothetical protein
MGQAVSLKISATLRQGRASAPDMRNDAADLDRDLRPLAREQATEGGIGAAVAHNAQNMVGENLVLRP